MESVTAEDLAVFQERGVLRVPGAFPRDLANQVADTLWDDLSKRRGVKRADPSTWGTAPWGGFRGVAPLLDQIGTPRLTAALSVVLGSDEWRFGKRMGAILAGPPVGHAAAWRPTARTWHFDGGLGESGVMFFALFARLEPHEGGTMLLEGSHHLVEHFHSEIRAEDRSLSHSELQARLIDRYDLLHELTRREPLDPTQPSFLEGRPWQTTRLRVVDVCGEPGDVLVCKLNLLHAPPTYVGPQPRFFMKGNVV